MQSDTVARPVLWNSNYLKVWIANFMLFFAFYLLAPLLPLYLRDTFSAGKAMIGIVLSGYTLTALAVRPFSGFVVDTFPRKKVLLICYFAFALLFAGYFITGSLVLFAAIRTLHGGPFGATTVASSTMAVDVLHPERRSEGIGYYGLSNNIAMAIGPSTGLYIYHTIHNFNLLFTMSLVIAFTGLIIDSTIKCRDRQPIKRDSKVSLDRFILLKGWSEGICIAAFAFSFGIISTYIAIYSQETLHITSGSGTFFMILACGLPYKMIDEQTQLEVIRTVSQHLLTPKGLRTLSPRNPLSKGSQEGTPAERDFAGKNGSVWPWLLSFYVRACFDVNGDSFLPQAEEMLANFEEDIQTYGIGSIGELFDADPPFSPRGAISQAWSVAAVLDIYGMIRRRRPEEKPRKAEKAVKKPAAKSAKAGKSAVKKASAAKAAKPEAKKATAKR